MNTGRTTAIFDRAPFSEKTLERMAIDALRIHDGILPRRPAVVPIESLIEARFGFNESYDNLGDGVLGEIRFGIEDRPLSIRLASHLAEINNSDPSIDHERRHTLAHECGHGLAHSTLFARRLRRDRVPHLPGFDRGQAHIACRDGDINGDASQPAADSAEEFWLEWEANYLMAALLLPRLLVTQTVEPWLTGKANGITARYLPRLHRQAAAIVVTQVFNVGEELARRRLDSLFAEAEHPDLFGNAGIEVSPSATQQTQMAFPSMGPDRHDASPDLTTHSIKGISLTIRI